MVDRLGWPICFLLLLLPLGEAHRRPADARDDDLLSSGRLLDQLAEMSFRVFESHVDHRDENTTLEVLRGNAEATSALWSAVANIFQGILMVDQLRASWNPLLAWLREVQVWGQAA